jgi:hypothetical protein
MKRKPKLGPLLYRQIRGLGASEDSVYLSAAGVLAGSVVGTSRPDGAALRAIL